ncbi:MAG TPA: protein adenylyltransferase SelO family protein, partial [Paracoccaceae bacterium]|nr:protein adenylyltransferase SelO family protein [Paracoccaceae bacterium]
MNRPETPPLPPLGLTHSYAEALPGAYAEIAPEVAPDPAPVWWNARLAQALGLPDLSPLQAARLVAGAALPPDARPIAQAYAGHQFGGFLPQLGDGRAILLGEVVDRFG